MRLVMLGVLAVSAHLSDGVLHAGSHWFILGGYAVSSLWLAATARRRDSERLAWIATLLDAALAAYIVLEYMMAAAEAADEPGTLASRLPAFLLLLESGLTLRPRHTAVFTALVAGVWSGRSASACSSPASACRRRGRTSSGSSPSWWRAPS